jgi:hypothetical protein
MRTDVQRIAAYNARMQSTEIDPVLTAVAPNAQVNFASYMADFYPKQLQLTQLMDTNGIPSYQRGWYQALLGQMYHTSKVASGGAAVAEFTSLVAKWEARGLGHGIMVQMAFVIFSVVIV